MRGFSILSLVLVVSLAVGAARGRPDSSPAPKADDSKKPKKEERPQPRLPAGHELMAAKLKHGQTVLEGLALGDMKKVGTSADELVRISQAAEFLNAYKSTEYSVQITMFRRSVEKLSKHAKDKNTDGAALAYMDMTLCCIKCHQHTRDKGDALLPLPKTPNILAGSGQ